MKRMLLIIFALSALMLWADDGVAQTMTKKYVVFEHFTNASCPPCAIRNPIFKENFEKVQSSAHHIAYHTDFPGFDPMYGENPEEVDERLAYYQVEGVPSFYSVGTESSETQVEGDVTGKGALGSPVQVLVKHKLNGDKVDITVTINALSDMGAGDWRVRTSVIEKIINYDRAPGSNGEAEFPNVFRKMVSGTAGDKIEALKTGESKTFTYSQELSESWIPPNLYTIAFVQNDDNKEILNSGSNLELQASIQATDNFVSTKEGEENVVLKSTFQPYFDEAATLDLVLEEDAPEGWKAAVVVDGIELPINSFSLPVEPNTVKTIEVKVTPSNKGFGQYTLSLKDQAEANGTPISQDFFVNNQTSTLVIYNDVTYNEDYKRGLNNASVDGLGVVSPSLLKAAMEKDAISDVKQIYYNIGWTFPAMADETATLLGDFLIGGGRLLIAGQDIAWDIMSMDDGSNGNTTTRGFFESFLQCEYVDDGGTANSTLTAVPDGFFGNLADSDLIAPYGADFYYPDVIRPTGFATPIFTYNNDPERVAGVRVDNGLFKVVYLGVGIEMMREEADRDAFLNATHDYFIGRITGAEYDAITKNILQQNYPNPADKMTYIELGDLEGPMTFELVNLNGQVVFSQKVEQNSNNLSLNTSNFQAGAYFYQLKNEAQQVVQTKKMMIVH